MKYLKLPYALIRKYPAEIITFAASAFITNYLFYVDIQKTLQVSQSNMMPKQTSLDNASSDLVVLAGYLLILGDSLLDMLPRCCELQIPACALFGASTGSLVLAYEMFSQEQKDLISEVGHRAA